METELLERTIQDLSAVQGLAGTGSEDMSAGGAREGGGGGAQDGCSSEDAISFFFENRGLAATLLHIAGLLGFAFGQRRSVLCCAASGCPQLFCFHVSAPPVVTLAFQTLLDAYSQEHRQRQNKRQREQRDSPCKCTHVRHLEPPQVTCVVANACVGVHGRGNLSPARPPVLFSALVQVSSMCVCV